eukprot:4655886-Pyramimonas_sp.AAC.1
MEEEEEGYQEERSLPAEPPGGRAQGEDDLGEQEGGRAREAQETDETEAAPAKKLRPGQEVDLEESPDSNMESNCGPARRRPGNVRGGAASFGGSPTPLHKQPVAARSAKSQEGPAYRGDWAVSLPAARAGRSSSAVSSDKSKPDALFDPTAMNLKETKDLPPKQESKEKTSQDT